MDYRFLQVDVFSDHVFGGNPLAVFPEPEGLDAMTMQALATEMNLAETTFVFPPSTTDALARIRIFTPGRELPFAGHPTLGTAYVLGTLGRLPDPEFVFEEGVGPISVRVEGSLSDPTFIWMSQPLPSFSSPILDRERVAGMLRLEPSDILDLPLLVGSAGVPFLYVPVTDRATVDRTEVVERDLSVLGSEETPQGLFVFSVESMYGQPSAYSRMFGSMVLNIAEDPATGGASGPLGVYMVDQGLIPKASKIEIFSLQGQRMGRPSTIYIRLRYELDVLESVEVGGSVVPVLEGTVHLR